MLEFEGEAGKIKAARYLDRVVKHYEQYPSLKAELDQLRAELIKLAGTSKVAK